MTGCMVEVKDDFCSSGSQHQHGNAGMNPNHSYGGPGPGYFGQPGPGFGPGPGGPGGYHPPHQGPMSPYQGGGGGPMSPYAGQSQGQPPPSGASPQQQQQQPLYGNQNSPFGSNQNQSSPYPGPGPYTNQSSGFHPQQTMQTYYNNHSPTHSVQHQFQFGPGGPPPPLRHPSPPGGPPPPPMSLMMRSTIPHPPINSPNQNLVTGNQMKSETADLKPGSIYSSPASHSYSQPYGYDGFGPPPPGSQPRPMMSPMSPHGRLNISPQGQPGPPNLSPHEAPPSMSPHHPPMGSSLYSQPQNSPGNSSIVTQASTFPAPSQHHQPYGGQYEYFSKQSPHSTMSVGSSGGGGGYGGHKDEQGDNNRGLGSYPSDDRLSDGQSIASVRSSGADTPKHNTFGDDNNTSNVLVKQEPPGEQLTNSEKTSTTGDEGNGKNSNQPGENNKENFIDVKLESGTYDEDCKDFTLKANQSLIDNVNLDSIPELPEIPELKFADVNEVAGSSGARGEESLEGAGKMGADPGDRQVRSQQSAASNSGMSPAQEDSRQGLSPGRGLSPGPPSEGSLLGHPSMSEFLDESRKGNEDSYHHDGMGFMQHLQGPLDGPMDGPMPSHFPPHQMGYPNQQQMWANFYNSGNVPPSDMNRFPHPGPMPPHLGMEGGGGGWWQGPPQPDMVPYRMGVPGVPPAPGAWALRGPRPRGERRGPGRPRLTTKGEKGSRPRNSTPGAPPFPASYPGQGDGPITADMLGGVAGDMKRGPGRPKAIQDPNAPKVPGETTKNGNKKRYHCEVCQKRFSTAWYVRVHRRSHNGERPYTCTNCGKGFMLPNVLQVHSRKCLKNNPPAEGIPPGGGPPPPIPPSPVSNSSQSPNNTASPNLSQPGHANYFSDPGSIPQSQNQPFPGIGGFNQRFLGGMTSPTGHASLTGPPPFNAGMGPDVPISQPQPFPPSDQGNAQGFNIQQHSPQMGNCSPVQFSPIYSPTNNLPIPSSDSGHFLANDKPRDKGGTAVDKPVPPGVDASLYCCACETSFEDKSSIEEHLKTHRPYSCEICEKRFSQKCNLITHMRLHTGEKPYNCNYCEKRFTQKGNLDAHLKTHTKEKPFQCMLCPKRFAFKSSMQSHVRGHQNGTSGLDDDTDDIECIKEQMKMQDYGRQLLECEQALSDQDQSLSPRSQDYAPHTPLATHNNTDNDISKLTTDSRQTLAMLQ